MIRKEMRKFSVIELEELAVHLYREKLKKHYRLDMNRILMERYLKLNDAFSWTETSKNKFLEINDKLMAVFENSYNEAVTTANELEQRIRNNDPFLKDYEIDIEIQPYIFDKNDYENDCIALVLSEPDYFPINFSIGNSHFFNATKELPIYMDKSLNWNQLYLKGIFDNYYICYQIHTLLENHWAFQDILNINQIWADVKVSYQHHSATG